MKRGKEKESKEATEEEYMIFSHKLSTKNAIDAYTIYFRVSDVVRKVYIQWTSPHKRAHKHAQAHAHAHTNTSSLAKCIAITITTAPTKSAFNYSYSASNVEWIFDIKFFLFVVVVLCQNRFQNLEWVDV